MDAVRIETLPTTKSLLSTNVPETTDISKEKDDDDILFVDEIDEDDEIRLRLSDDEEVEQDNTSGHAESQQTSLQLKRNDLEFDVRIAVSSKETTSHHTELIIKQDLNKIDTATLVVEDESSGNSSLDEKFVNEICNLNDEESTMSGSERIPPPLMHNSPKYWSSNFDKRWKGVNSSRNRQSVPHRNSDWYNQQYSDKDKFNNRHSFNNHNNHFNKLRNNARGSYNNQSRENCNKEVKKDEISESVKLKSNISNSKDTNNSTHLIQENGISDDIKLKENDSPAQNDKPITEDTKLNENETKKVEINSDQKENEPVPDELKLSFNHKNKESVDDKNNDNSKNSEKIKNSEEELTDAKNKNDSVLFETKNCDVSMTEIKEEKCESQSENISQEKSKSDCGITEKQISDDTNSLSNNAELQSKENSVNSEVSSEMEIKIAEIASHNDILKKDKSENLMEVDDDNKNSGNVDNKISGSESGKAKDFDLKISKNYDETLSQDVEDKEKLEDKEISEDKECISEKVEQQTDSTNEDSDKKSNDNETINEDSNHSMEDSKSIANAKMEVSENGPTDDNGSSGTTDNEVQEAMDVETDVESSTFASVDVAEIKDSDSSDSKSLTNNDDKNSTETSSLIINEDTCKKEEKIPLIKSDEELEKTDKQLEDASTEGVEKSNSTEGNQQEKVNNIIEEVDLVDDEPEMVVNDVLKTQEVDVTSDTSRLNKDISQTVPISTTDGSKVEESNEDGRAVVHKRRRRKRQTGIIYQEIPVNEIQTENGVRQKRRSARNAEEMIRKEILKDDEDDEDSNDDDSKLVPIHYKKAHLQAQPLSPPSLKRTLEDMDCVAESTATLKRIKSSADSSTPVAPVTPVAQPQPQSQPQERREHVSKSKESIAETNELVRKISQEDIRGKLKKLKQEELEALLLQKIVECITIRGEMGKLREQARVSKRNQEATRAKCQQLQKQVEGFDMVLKRISYDKNSNSDKFIAPIKINRSVGLQVNFLSTEHGIQNLKQIQTLKASANAASSNTAAAKVATTSSPSGVMIQDNRSLTQSPRKMLKTRSPRRPEIPTPTVIQTIPSSASTVTGATPTALVMSKSIDQTPKRTVNLPNSNSVLQVVSPGQQQQQQQSQQQTVVVNSSVGGASNRSTTLTIQRSSNNSAGNKTSDLIDLTDEEDKSKAPVITPITSALTTRLSRVLQAVPASVALTNTSNLRLVQTSNQGSPTAIVNNINNTPRLAYVMQSGVTGVPTRQLVLTSSNTIRPVTSVSTRNISTISYKQGVPTLTNGTVRVLTTQAPTANLQVSRHPAPLPETPLPEPNPMWKLPPPAPSLKISKVATGIVLSWNMTLSDKFAEIVSYQLYAYQEVAGTSPSAALWKKVGDVRALPLPMACTLTQFTEGNNYYFAVRAVDIHSRFGQYSKPGNISL